MTGLQWHAIKFVSYICIWNNFYQIDNRIQFVEAFCVRQFSYKLFKTVFHKKNTMTTNCIFLSIVMAFLKYLYKILYIKYWEFTDAFSIFMYTQNICIFNIFYSVIFFMLGAETYPKK